MKLKWYQTIPMNTIRFPLKFSGKSFGFEGNMPKLDLSKKKLKQKNQK